MKFERTQIHFFSDVFTAVVVVAAYGPYYPLWLVWFELRARGKRKKVLNVDTPERYPALQPAYACSRPLV